jgi:hypothetical protein
MSFNSPFTGNVVQPTDVSYRRIILTTDLQLEWPINGTSTDDAAARIMEVSTASSANELWMPPANQASVGQDALIRNVGAVAVTVKDYTGANTIVTIAAGEAQYIYIVTNATTAGTWGIIAFGIGSSGADAATLAGYGLIAIGQTLNQSQPVTNFSSNYTAVFSDLSNAYVWTGGAGTLTLSSATTFGQFLVHAGAQRWYGRSDSEHHWRATYQRLGLHHLPANRLSHHRLLWHNFLHRRFGQEHAVRFYPTDKSRHHWNLHPDRRRGVKRGAEVHRNPDRQRHHHRASNGAGVLHSKRHGGWCFKLHHHADHKHGWLDRNYWLQPAVHADLRLRQLGERQHGAGWLDRHLVD